MTRILLLETDKVLAQNIDSMFRTMDFEVDWQVDPQEAVISMDEHPVDAIIMDLILVGRSGIEFLYELRSYPDWQTLPVILLSSVPPREIYSCVVSLQQLDIHAYHYKPATRLSDLVTSVQSCLLPALI
jgi:DNA-binding response OmpR family regulator